MANLGDNNTPVEGESFGLPSGYAVDEENGDLVIRDTDGTVAMRRADGTAWQLEGSDISGVGAFDSESVNTERVDINDYPILKSKDGYKWGFNGDSPIERLESALNEATRSSTIVLEPVVYDSDFTLDQEDHIFLKGNYPVWGSINRVPRIDGTWTIEALRVGLEGIHSSGGEIVFESQRSGISGSAFSGDITFQDDSCFVFETRAASVTFESGTTGGIVDSCSDVAVTDNGDNTMGDIA